MAGTKTLSGITIVEMGGLGPVPWVGMILGELGADVTVIRREEKRIVDDRFGDRNWPVAGKCVRYINAKSTLGREILQDIIRNSDMLLEGFRPGVMERLGLGPEECFDLNDTLIYGRMTGWGREGLWADKAGHDINYLSVTGVLASMGRIGHKPTIPLNLVGDFGGGAMFLLAGLLQALYVRERDGGCYLVDASMVEGISKLMTSIYERWQNGCWIEERGGNSIDGGWPWYDVYETSDARYLAIGAIEEKFYGNLMRGLGLSEIDVGDREDKANWGYLRSLFERRIRSKSLDEWKVIFSNIDACVTPVLTIPEALFVLSNEFRSMLVLGESGVRPRAMSIVSRRD